MSRRKNVKQIDRKSTREELGYTQSQLSELLGVSRRSIIRYEKGQTKSGKAFATIQQFYNNVPPLVKEIKKKSERALNSYKSLTKEISKQGDAPSVVQRYYENYLSGDKSDYKGKNIKELKNINEKLDKFLSWKTSTPEGYKDWKKNVTKSSMTTSGEKKKGYSIGDDYGTGNVGYWKLYNRINERKEWKKIIMEQFMMKLTPSESIQQFITMYRSAKVGFKEIERILEREEKRRLVEENEENLKIFNIRR